MFFVIDRRYRSSEPLIVTTDLKLEENKNPPALACARLRNMEKKDFLQWQIQKQIEASVLLFYFHAAPIFPYGFLDAP